VYDVDSIGLIRIMDHLNHGCDLAGNLIGPALSLHIGCGADPGRPDYEKELRRLEEKVQAGAEYIMTQPVYDPRAIERFLRDIKHLDTPVLIGILPLYSHRNAEFLHNEVPGMSIPDDIRERMRVAGSGDDAQREGVSIAQEALRAARDVAQGVYIMPPFNKVDLALRVVDALEGGG
jgi:homocysteine S-methyltransferase